MEEDIKKIEYFLNQADEYYDGNIDIKDCVITKEVAEAIENLIKRHKELKEERQYEKELRLKYERRYDLAIENRQKNFIRKSRVKLEIKELENRKDYKPLDNRYTYKELIEFGIEELEQILQEGDDK